MLSPGKKSQHEAEISPQKRGGRVNRSPAGERKTGRLLWEARKKKELRLLPRGLSRDAE